MFSFQKEHSKKKHQDFDKIYNRYLHVEFTNRISLQELESFYFYKYRKNFAKRNMNQKTLQEKRGQQKFVAFRNRENNLTFTYS